MGSAGAKAFGDTLLVNKTIQTLDVSDNGLARPSVGDQVKIKSSGERCSVTDFRKDTGVRTSASTSSSGKVTGYFLDTDYTFDSQIPAFCAGVAASPSLISVSTTFRHARDVIFLTPPLFPTTCT
jgi:hypothetical protein